MPAPVQSPEERAKAIEEARIAEARALAELKADPTGANSVAGVAQEDVELLAMLAGSTSQTLRQAKFVDNTMAPTASQVLDPKAVVGGLIQKVNPQARPTPQPRRIDPSKPSAGPIGPSGIPGVVGIPVAPAANDPQLELDLYKKMDMTDVYNVLDQIKEELKQIKAVQVELKKFMDSIAQSS